MLHMLTMTGNKDLIDALNRLEKDQKITIIGYNDFGFIQSTQTRFHNYEVKSSNPHNESVQVIHKPKNKRKYFRKSLENKDLIILDGWYDIVQKSDSNYSKNGLDYQEFSCFNENQLKDVALIYENETLFSNIKIN